MTLRSVVLSILFLALFTFAGINWNEFSTPQTLSFGFTVLQVPVGFVMLAFIIVIVTVMLAYVLFLQAKSALEQRRLFGELEAQRLLADKAEASRIADLHKALQATTEQMQHSLKDATATLDSQLRLQSEAAQRFSTENTNALSAHLAELEDKLDRVLADTRRTPAL